MKDISFITAIIFYGLSIFIWLDILPLGEKHNVFEQATFFVVKACFWMLVHLAQKVKVK